MGLSRLRRRWGSDFLAVCLAIALLLGTPAAQQDGQDDAIAYDSIIKPLVRSVYWHVTGQGGRCTAVHALNSSTGKLVWRRSPVDPEQRWSMQVTDKRAFFVLANAPLVSAVSTEGGNQRWAWPERVGHFWKRLDTDLPQHSPLVAPLPALASQLLLLRSESSDNKVLALNMLNGTLAWELDTRDAIAAAASHAGLGPPQNLSIGGWVLESPGLLYVYANALHDVLPLPTPKRTTAAGTGSSALGKAGGQQPGQQQQQQHGMELEPQRAWGRGGPQVAGWPEVAGSPSSEVSGQRRALLQDQVDVSARGWVLALVLEQGALVWCSGPLEQGVAGVQLSEPVLLVSSRDKGLGAAWLYGLDKDSGALIYSLPNAGLGIQVVDTRVGLLTSGLRQRPLPLLDTLAAFDLATGKVLWQGMVGSALLPLVTGDCTAVAAPRLHLYFACSCNWTAHAAGRARARTDASPGQGSGGTPLAGHEQQARWLAARRQAGAEQAAWLGAGAPAMLGPLLPQQDPWAAAEAAAAVLPGGTKPAKRPPSPPPPPPRPEPGLCAFAMSSDTGRLGAETMLSSQDAVPEDAYAYGLAPLIMADLVIYPGRHGVYATARLAINGSDTHLSSPFSSSSSLSASDAPGGTASSPAHAIDATAAASSRPGNAPAVGLGGGGNAPAQVAGGQEHGSPGAAATTALGAKVNFSFRLPLHAELRAWDWMELRLGQLLLRASPRQGAPPPPPWPSAWPPSPTDPPRFRAGRPGTAPEAAGSGRGTGASGGATSWCAGEGKGATPPPSSFIFSLDTYSGDLKWQLCTNLTAGPLSPHAMPRNWGRGGLLLVDGCRPPLADGGRGGAGGFAVRRRDGGALGVRGAGGRWDRWGGAAGPEEEGAGTSCCLLAVVAETGQVSWRHCFDLDQACQSGIARHTATKLVYALLGVQVAVLLGGCVVWVVARHRLNQTRHATTMEDPNSEFDFIEVPAPGAPPTLKEQQHECEAQPDSHLPPAFWE